MIELTNIIIHLNYITCREVINVLDRMGNTPLHYATQMWSQSVVRMLLERGANIGMKGRRKNDARLRETRKFSGELTISKSINPSLRSHTTLYYPKPPKNVLSECLRRGSGGGHSARDDGGLPRRVLPHLAGGPHQQRLQGKSLPSLGFVG